MTAALKTKWNWVVIAVAMGIVTILCATALPVNAVTSTGNAPSIANINKDRSLSLNGDNLLPVFANALSAATQGPLAVPVAPMASSAIAGAASIFGSPAATAPVTLAGCGFLGLGCVVDVAKGVWDVVVAVADCTAGVVVTFSTHACTQALAKVLGDLLALALWAISGTIEVMAGTIAQGMQKAALGWANWVLTTELSGNNNLTEPTVSCQNAKDTIKSNNCKDVFFLGQYNIMRHVAMFMLLPLFMLVVIQAILKGSMYLLVRSAFVMLPVSIVGMVVAVFVTQLLLNISNDFVMMIGNYTTSTTKFATTFTATVSGMNVSKVNWYALLWMFVLLFATVIIYVELLLRQVGVYMSAMFLPLAFAALVWPSSAGFAKKIFELLVGLIFSKVFIAAAVSLGIEAFASGSAVGVNTLPGGMDNATSAGLTALISGSLIFCMAAFAGTKVIAMSPAAITAAEGRVMNTSAAWGKFQLSNATLGRAANAVGRRNNNRGTSRAAQAYQRATGNGFTNQGQVPAGSAPRGPARVSPGSPGSSSTPTPPATQRKPWKGARAARAVKGHNPNSKGWTGRNNP